MLAKTAIYTGYLEKSYTQALKNKEGLYTSNFLMRFFEINFKHLEFEFRFVNSIFSRIEIKSTISENIFVSFLKRITGIIL